MIESGNEKNKMANQPEGETKTDCYSDGDRKFMNWGQKVRAKLFNPILLVLDKMGCTPNFITYVSLVVGFIACYALTQNTTIALLLLFLHVVLDGFDGPLARYQKVDSSKGSFTDTMVDQIIITVTTITLIYMGTIGIFAGGIYIFLYTMIIVFSMIRNALEIPYSWLVRPRFIVYLWLIVEFFLVPNTINYLLWAFNVILLFKMVTGFVAIRKKM